MTKHPLSDLDAEMRDHIARETQDNIDRGMPADEARRAALRRFGNTALVGEDARAVWVPAWVDHLRQDIRYALRMLVRHAGFSIVAIATLAFGIGLTTAVFSVVYSVLLRPLPYDDGERIVLVRETLVESIGSASAGHFHDWSGQATVFDATAAGQPATYNLADAGEPERITGMRVTPGYFEVAHMPPAAGRYFTPRDLEAEPRLVVLGYGLWQRRFGGDPAIVGRAIRLSGDPYVVVGVAPQGYALTDPARAGVTGGFSAQLWTALTFSPAQQANYGNHAYLVLGKLKAGITRDTAQADLERITAGIAERNPREMASRGVTVLRLEDVLVGGVSTQLFVLFATVGFVLVIGCVNIGSLLLARATTRHREIAIRASLGGGRHRIVRQLLTESVVLAVPGGVAALGVAALAIRYFVASGPAFIPRLHDAGLRAEVLLFATAITVMAAIAFGLAPALRAARIDLQSSLKNAASALAGGRQDRLRSLMVVTEIAITVVLLAGTGLLFRSAEQLARVPLGFNAHGVLTARLTLPAARYGEPAVVAGAFRAILDQMRELGGLEYAAAATGVPLTGGSADAAVAAEGVAFPPGAAPSPHIRLISDGYIEAMGFTLLRGRSLQAADLAAGAPPVVVINERLAAALWPGTSPIGKRVSTWTAGPDPEWREVVGVVAGVRTFGQSEPVPLELFMPYTQAPSGAWNAFQRSMVLVLRPREGWPEGFAPHLKTAVAGVDPSAPLYDVRTMEGIVVAATAGRRFYLRLILLLAATGLGLAVLGVYGVIAYFVTERTGEIGLRMAIGARRPEVVRMVVARGLRLALLGVAVGVPGALLLTRLISNLLYGVGPTDPLTFVSVASLLIVTSVLASLVPAAKAARVDPLHALRHE